MKLPWVLILITFLCRVGAAEEWEVTYEVFSLPLKEAAKLRREKLGGVASHERILTMLGEKEVRQEKWMVVKVMGGKVATLEEVEEMIYTTEYEPLELPSMVGEWKSKKPPPFPIPNTASAYDTKNTGDTLEVGVRVVDGEVTLRLNSTKISLVRLDEFGEKTAKVEMPRFAVQKIRTLVGVTDGKPALVGTISPPSDLQEGDGKRVWLAFATASRVL